MADVNRGNRPLSPHLSVYHFGLTMFTSIVHRITGVGMALGLVLVVWWFLAASTGPEYYATANAFLTSWFGILILVGSLWALWYHFCNGIRHLLWDVIIGLENGPAAKSGVAVIICSVLLTILTLVIV